MRRAIWRKTGLVWRFLRQDRAAVEDLLVKGFFWIFAVLCTAIFAGMIYPALLGDVQIMVGQLQNLF